MSEKLPIRVLLVEDEPVSALLAMSVLKNVVEHVDSATDGEQALRAVETRDYDVILMDCLMPVLDGYEATRRIRAREKDSVNGRRSYIVALTASPLPEDRDRCLAAGMDAFLSKPYKPAALREALLQAMQGRRRQP